MKKAVWITIGVIAVAGIGFYVYNKKYGRPKVTIDKIDWLTGNGTIFINGKKTEITKATAVQVGDYSVGYATAYVTEANGQDIASVVLKKGDSIVETITSR